MQCLGCVQGVSFYELFRQCTLPHQTFTQCSDLEGRLPNFCFGASSHYKVDKVHLHWPYAGTRHKYPVLFLEIHLQCGREEGRLHTVLQLKQHTHKASVISAHLQLNVKLSRLPLC